jgi:hypothetical protein
MLGLCFPEFNQYEYSLIPANVSQEESSQLHIKTRISYKYDQKGLKCADTKILNEQEFNSNPYQHQKSKSFLFLQQVRQFDHHLMIK